MKCILLGGFARIYEREKAEYMNYLCCYRVYPVMFLMMFIRKMIL